MKKILAIDDQKDNLTTIKAVLDSQLPGIKILNALSGAEGIKIAIKEQPDTIILDLIMPMMDGYEVCIKLKENEFTKHIPIIMLTAIKTDAKSRIKGLTLGADAFLSKPIDPLELSTQVKVMLRIKEAEDKLRDEKSMLEKLVEERTASLYDSELYYRTLIENSSDVIIIIDKNGKLVFESQSNEVITGYKTGELLGENIFGIIHADDLEHVSILFEEIIKKPQGIENVNFRIIHKDESTRSISGTGKNMLHFPKINGIVFNYRDVTEHTKALNAKLESDRKLNTLINNLKGIAYRCKNDRNWTMEYLSAGFEEITGYKVEDVINNKKMSFDDIIEPEDRDRIWTEIQSSIGKKESFELNYKIKTASGEIKYVLEKGVAIYSEDKTNLLGLEGFITDITTHVSIEKALRESENNFRTLFNAMTDVVLELDYDGRFINIAPTSQELLYLPPDEMIGHTLHEVFPQPEADIFLEFVRKCIDENEIKSLMYSLVINDATKWFEGRGIPKSTNSILYIARDITMAKKSEDEFRKLSSAVKQSPSVFVITDIDGKIEYVNPKFTELTGYEPEEVIGRKSNILKSGHQTLEEYKELWETIISGDKWKGEFHNKKKNGKLFWEEASISPIIDENGKIINFIKVAEDITEQKKAKKALQESEYKYQKLIETSSEGFWLIDTKGVTLDVNLALCEMLGYTREEIMGKTPYDFAENENIRIFKEQIARANSDKQRKYEISLRTKSGNYIPTLFNATSISDNDGKFAGSFAFITNISENKRAAQLQKVLYNISNAAISSGNLNTLIALIQEELGKIIDTTNFFVALYDKETNMLSLPFFSDQKDKMVSIPSGKSLTDYVIRTQKSLLANRKDKAKLEELGEIRRIGSDSKIWLGVPLKIENEVIGVLVVQSYTDEKAFNESDMKMLEFISEQVSISINKKKVEEGMISALEKATESDRLKTAFLQNISHEIRTPMNGIMGFTGLLKDTTLSGTEQQSYLDVILISGHRMLNTLNDLMDMSMLETGQVKMNISTININDELSILYNFFKLEVEKKGMLINFQTALPNNEVVIKTDREKLFAILSNLIKNAIKYSHIGSISFGYVLKGYFLEFFVEDTGIGIPKDRQQAIFDRFVQADIEDIKVYEGSGLGLSISKAYIELIGGEIWVESTEGKGSKFYFTLPYNPESITMEFDETEISEIKTSFQQKQLKILIAEDEEIAFDYLHIVLENSGTELINAKNGAEAVDVMRNNPDIDLVLMDIRMPIMDGYEATHEIRSFNKDVVIIAQTAYALAGDKEKALNAGCNDYISKPISRNKLLELINKYYS